MSFIELAKKRYSCRKYKQIAVEEYKLLQVLEAGRLAPSAANRQPSYFIVIRNEQQKANFASCYQREWLKTAPVIIVVCADHSKSWKRAYDSKDSADIDASIAIDHMTLMAADLGLATCWICAFDPVICREILELPDGIEPVAIFPLGYPDDFCDVDRHETKRKKLDEIVRWEKYY